MCEFLEMLKESYILISPLADKLAGYRDKNAVFIDRTEKTTKVVSVECTRYIRNIEIIETLTNGKEPGEFYLVSLEGDVATIIHSSGQSYGLIDLKVSKISFTYLHREFGWELSERVQLEEKTNEYKKFFSYLTYNGGSWFLSLRQWWKDEEEEAYYEYD